MEKPIIILIVENLRKSLRKAVEEDSVNVALAFISLMVVAIVAILMIAACVRGANRSPNPCRKQAPTEQVKQLEQTGTTYITHNEE